MNKTNQVLESLKGGPLNKAGITETTGIKGLPLFNLIKQMVKDGQLTVVGEGNDAAYSIPRPMQHTRHICATSAVKIRSPILRE